MKEFWCSYILALKVEGNRGSRGLIWLFFKLQNMIDKFWNSRTKLVNNQTSGMFLIFALLSSTPCLPNYQRGLVSFNFNQLDTHVSVNYQITTFLLIWTILPCNLIEYVLSYFFLLIFVKIILEISDVIVKFVEI